MHYQEFARAMNDLPIALSSLELFCEKGALDDEPPVSTESMAAIRTATRQLADAIKALAEAELGMGYEP